MGLKLLLFFLFNFIKSKDISFLNLIIIVMIFCSDKTIKFMLLRIPCMQEKIETFHKKKIKFLYGIDKDGLFPSNLFLQELDIYFFFFKTVSF